jgi:Na+/pantothenate symporter
VFLADDPFHDVTCHGAMVLLLFFIFNFGGFVQLFTRVTSNGQGVGPYGWDQEHSNMFPAFVLRFVIFLCLFFFPHVNALKMSVRNSHLTSACFFSKKVVV